LHEAQSKWNVEAFERDPMEVPRKRHFHPISDVVHLLKRVRYRMLKSPPMVVPFDRDSPELNLRNLQSVPHMREHLGTGSELNSKLDTPVERTPSGDRWLKQIVHKGSM
jgi:hypothetical protein